MTTQKSAKMFAEACDLMPGGVNSPVRAFGGVGGEPLFLDRAQGAYVWDVDGNKYIDYVGSWGPAILGHAHPQVIKVINEVAEGGLSFGAPTEGEIKLAKLIQGAMPSIEKIRLVSSGTEACMSALRLARAYTKRDRILKFSGCYHGHADMLLVQAGSGALTLGLPDSPGVPSAATQHTLVAPFNDLSAVAKVFTEYSNQIAAVIIEPIVGNSGFIRPQDGFLEGLQEECKKTGTLLIFDEVMTGFRVAFGGVQGLKGITPDLTTLGKVIGGGMPIGAYGGRREIMDLVAPKGPVYQAGTLSGNPVAVACGLKTLEILSGSGNFLDLSFRSKKLVNGLSDLAAKHRIPFIGDWEGGMFGFFFHGGPVISHEQAKASHHDRFKTFFHGMLRRGIYFAPSPFEAGFVSLAHVDSDIATTLASAAEVLEEMAA